MVEDPSLTGVIGVIVLVSCYFMPTIVALVRDKRGAGGIALAVVTENSIRAEIAERMG